MTAKFGIVCLGLLLALWVSFSLALVLGGLPPLAFMAVVVIITSLALAAAQLA